MAGKHTPEKDEAPTAVPKVSKPSKALKALKASKAASRPDAKPDARPEEIGGRKGPEPTRYGDWEVKGICSDF